MPPLSASAPALAADWHPVGNLLAVTREIPHARAMRSLSPSGAVGENFAGCAKRNSALCRSIELSVGALRSEAEDMMRLKQVGGFLIVALITGGSGAAAQAAPAPGGAQAADKGAAVFAAQKCSLCHSLDGKGNAKGPLDDIGSKLTADEIRQWIVDAGGDGAPRPRPRASRAMKAFPTLPKEDLDALVAFMRVEEEEVTGGRACASTCPRPHATRSA